MSSKYDKPIELYRGEIPLSVVKGLIAAESNWKPGAVNNAPDAPGGGPKIGLMQPSRAGLKDAVDVDTVDPSYLKNPVNNIRVGTSILNAYWQRLRRDFPAGFAKPLEQDANAVALLVHAYTLGYDVTKKLLEGAGTTSYRELEQRFPGDVGIARRWSDRVLDAARKQGYRPILPAGRALPVPSPAPPGGGGRRTPNLPADPTAKKRGSALLVLGALAIGGGLLVYLGTKKGRRRAA